MKRRLVLLATLLMFALLTLSLDSQSLWWDEGISLHLATSTWSEIIADRASNIHPPLYFFALKIWVNSVGVSSFTGRFFSVLAVTLIPALSWRFFEKRLNVKSGYLSIFLLALAPPLIVYGQETRAYAFLALFWLLLVDRIWLFVADVPQHWSQKKAIRFGVISATLQVSSVLFHYTAIFGIALVNFVCLIAVLEKPNKYKLTAWVTSIAGMLLGGLLWLIPVMQYRFIGLTQQAGLANVRAEPVTWQYVLRLLATFQFFGVPSLRFDTLTICLLGILASTLLLASIRVLIRPGTKRTALSLLGIWLVPFLPAPFIWTSSPQAHPRYLMPYVLGGWIFLGWLTSINSVPKVVRILLVLSVLGLSAIGLHHYLFDETSYKSDVRALAAYLRGVETGGVVIVPTTDWSLAQYATGSVDVLMVPDKSLWTDAEGWFESEVIPREHVYLLDYERDALDPEDQLRAALSNRGWITERIDAHGVFLERYKLDAPDACHLVSVREINACTRTGLCLVDAILPDAVVSGAQTGIHLRWFIDNKIETQYSVALRVYAPNGALVASQDDVLVSLQSRPTDYWPEGEAIDTYHVLHIPAGALPLGYTLKVGVYDTAEPESSVTLHMQSVASADVVAGELYPVISPWNSGPAFGVIREMIAVDLPADLIDWHANREVVSPGESIFVSLYWRVEDWDNEMGLTLVLEDDTGNIVAKVQPWQAFSTLPTGRLVYDVVRIDIPVDAPSGIMNLILIEDNIQMIPLDQIQVSETVHEYSLPEIDLMTVNQSVDTVATLVAYRIEALNDVILKAGQPVEVSLVWQALGDASRHNLKSFVHLYTPDGLIIAQHDGIPVNWSRPTSSWVAGEYLVDKHEITWLQSYHGPALMVAGLYDPETGQRLVWENGQDVLSLVDITVE